MDRKPGPRERCFSRCVGCNVVHGRCWAAKQRHRPVSPHMPSYLQVLELREPEHVPVQHWALLVQLVPATEHMLRKS